MWLTTAQRCIVCNKQMRLVERAQHPCKGQLDFSGGFVDYNESNQQALKTRVIGGVATAY
jgi:NAD+ diphosphatase